MTRPERAPSNDHAVFVLVGPGGVGKGTIVHRLVERDPTLWLSRSWTTRAPRPGEAHDAYVFADRARFEAKIAEGGFLEWAEFLGNLYGTPVPAPPPGHDVILEIEVQGAEQVRALRPDAVVILIDVPDRSEQARRMAGRGDPPDKIAARVDEAAREIERAQALHPHSVVNRDLDTAVAEVEAVIASHRAGAA